MHISDRFGKLWETWDAQVADGAKAKALLNAAKDEDLIELLAGESARNRKWERDIVATEILNRLHRRNTDLPRTADAALGAARDAQDAARAGQADIHASETLLHAAGEHELGARVSASAYASLDAADSAVHAASQHAAGIKSTMGTSRHADHAGDARHAESKAAAKDVARAAQRGREVTDDLEHKMGPMGEGPAGAAAAKAGRAISTAADAGARAAGAGGARKGARGDDASEDASGSR